MKKLQLLIIGIVSIFGISLASVSQPASAINLFSNCDASDAICQEANKGSGATNSLVQNVIRILLWTIGVISVIMIVVGGIRYAVSGGDQKAVTDAKNTILYAVVGLVVAMLAYAIVYFITDRF